MTGNTVKRMLRHVTLKVINKIDPLARGLTRTDLPSSTGDPAIPTFSCALRAPREYPAVIEHCYIDHPPHYTDKTHLHYFRYHATLK
ncbi:hypothetical protein GJAV_G00160870 [Gymnothorax javanicus]|nr:hypothetical protein GJAV_G00160870 [Gymnothorax javanicus]